ncbi:ATP-binding protein [Candidatus Undinarchaeota archaeon]
MEVGTVISTFEGPSPTNFSFVVNEKAGEIPIKKNQFVELISPQGKIVAIVEDIKKTNRYFERAESVREYERSGVPMNSIFPTDRWEYLMAEAKCLGVYTDTSVERANFPPSPGTKVNTIDNSTLKTFLGLVDDGIELGKVDHHNLPVKLNLTRLVQKHWAMLGISGSGKSYAVSVMLEELLDRKPEAGRIALFIVDVHGEYTGFAKTDKYKDRIKIIKGSDIRIGTSNLSGYAFASLLPNMSGAQVRDLSVVINKLKKEKKKESKPYNVADLLAAIEKSEDVKENTSKALIGWLRELNYLKLFNYNDFPGCGELKPGHALIIDLSDITSLRKKQTIVAYFSRKFFDQRKKGLIPPYVEILEEAHQFAPESTKRENALSAPILKTIAREGRKFYSSLCLISQRPIQLSTTVLSQCNTHFILRITNPYDLKHLGESSEGITQETLNTISSLRVGEGLIVGEAVNFPVFVKIRKRKSENPDHALPLQEYAQKYEDVITKNSEDAKAFM